MNIPASVIRQVAEKMRGELGITDVQISQSESHVFAWSKTVAINSAIVRDVFPGYFVGKSDGDPVKPGDGELKFYCLRADKETFMKSFMPENKYWPFVTYSDGTDEEWAACVDFEQDGNWAIQYFRDGSELRHNLRETGREVRNILLQREDPNS